MTLHQIERLIEIWSWKQRQFYCFRHCYWLQHLATSCGFWQKWTR